MAIYDSNGNEIGGIITDEQVRLAFMNALADGTIVIGGIVGNTLGIDTHNFNSGYVDTAYASLLSAYKAHPNSVPFFMQTDEHGRGMEIQRYANNIDIDGVEFANLNGGDSVVDTYSATALEDVYDRIEYVKNYIGTPGNHDYKPPSGETVSEFEIRKAFCTTNLERRMICTSDLDSFVAYMPIHTVKFLCLDFYNPSGIISGMPHPYVDTATATWMIEELSRDDGNDIVIFTHEPTWVTYKGRDDENYTSASSVASRYYLYLARKNKTSGTFTDDEGVTHSYDFTSCKTNLLCAISGHNHAEQYSDKDGLTVYAGDWCGANKFGGVFGLIDRDSDLLRIFRFDSVSGVLNELDISLQFN